MNKQIQVLFEDYKKGGLDRRNFLKKLSLYAGGTASAAALLPLLEDNHAYAATRPGTIQVLYRHHLPGDREVKAFSRPGTAKNTSSYRDT
jgi:hypothetical protein